MYVPAAIFKSIQEPVKFETLVYTKCSNMVSALKLDHGISHTNLVIFKHYTYTYDHFAEQESDAQPC